MENADSDFLTVKAACALLGISPNTLRSWGASGKITEYRHPVNNYRLFRQEDIEKLADQLKNPQPVKSLEEKKGER